MPRKVTALSAAFLAAGGAGSVALAQPAAAACNGGDRAHSVQTFRGDHLLQGSSVVTNIAGGKERWCDIRTAQSYVGGGLPLPRVCDYQGQVTVYNPDGSSANRSHTSGFHNGCSLAGWFFHDPLDGNYAENKRFTTKWRSDATNGNWVVIGTLVD